MVKNINVIPLKDPTDVIDTTNTSDNLGAKPAHKAPVLPYYDDTYQKRGLLAEENLLKVIEVKLSDYIEVWDRNKMSSGEKPTKDCAICKSSKEEDEGEHIDFWFYINSPKHKIARWFPVSFTIDDPASDRVQREIAVCRRKGIAFLRVDGEALRQASIGGDVGFKQTLNTLNSFVYDVLLKEPNFYKRVEDFNN